MVFIAELFWWFEVVKPDFVKPRDLQEIKDGENVQQCQIFTLLVIDINTLYYYTLYIMLYFNKNLLY